LSAEELERAAIHEAGHILMAVVHGGPNDIHAVVARSRRSSGFVVSKNREPSAGTLDEYRLVLQNLLAGRAAEELEFSAAGSGAGGSLGSDLDQATRIAAAMVGSFGHAGPHPLLFLAERHRTDVIMNHAYLRTAIHLELATAGGASGGAVWDASVDAASALGSGSCCAAGVLVVVTATAAAATVLATAALLIAVARGASAGSASAVRGGARRSTIGAASVLSMPAEPKPASQTTAQPPITTVSAVATVANRCGFMIAAFTGST
jgi:hypothetical protein